MQFSSTSNKLPRHFHNLPTYYITLQPVSKKKVNVAPGVETLENTCLNNERVKCSMDYCVLQGVSILIVENLL